MSSWLSAAAEFLAAWPELAYAAVFLLALAEAIPVAGTIIPGSAAIIAISALAPSGVVRLWPLVASATAGAIAGDGLAFWLGMRHQRAILGLWPINRYPRLIQSSEAFIARHGRKSVFLARFTPGVRALVPLLAGILGMPARRFYLANVASALVWAPAHVLPGMLVGASFGLLGSAARPLGALVLLLVVVLWLLVKAVRIGLNRGIPLLLDLAERLRAWAATRDSRLGRTLVALLDPDRHEARALAALALVLASAAWLFFGILEDIVTGEPLVGADAAIYQALQDLRTLQGDRAMVAITELGDTLVATCVALAVFLWLAWKRAWRAARFWLIGIAGATILNTGIKAALHRPRPGDMQYQGWSAFSFPSGHSTINAVLYGLLVFLVLRELRPSWRLPVAAGAASLVALIAVSRLYLGAHWFSDVAGGLTFGIAFLSLLGMLYFRRPAEPVAPAGLLTAAGATLLVAGGANIVVHHAADMTRYATPATEIRLATDAWRDEGWQRLPTWRIDLTGEREEPLTLQWAGSLEALESRLAASGWRRSAPLDLHGALAFLAAPDPLALPVVPTLAGGRLPSLILVRPDAGAPGSRLALRIWSTDFTVGADPLWVGSVVEERLERPLSLVTVTPAQGGADAPRAAVVEALPGAQPAPRPGIAPRPTWDGQVLLADDTNGRTD